MEFFIRYHFDWKNDPTQRILLRILAHHYQFNRNIYWNYSIRIT